MSKLTKKDTNPVYDEKGNLIEFTIKREKWGQKFLMPNENSGCCLGHYALACGLDRETLLNDKGGLLAGKGIFPDEPAQIEWLTGKAGNGSSNQGTLATINDTGGDDRETRISRIFAKNGIKVNFI